jgi:hypothetical protein
MKKLEEMSRCQLPVTGSYLEREERRRTKGEKIEALLTNILSLSLDAILLSDNLLADCEYGSLENCKMNATFAKDGSKRVVSTIPTFGDPPSS